MAVFSFRSRDTLAVGTLVAQNRRDVAGLYDKEETIMRTHRTPTPVAILVMTALGALALPAVVRAAPQQAAPSTSNPAANLRVETLASGLDTPWDLAWGPDGAIWFTERAGRVSRVDPETGAITLVGRD